MPGIDHEQNLLEALEDIGPKNKQISSENEAPTSEVETFSKEQEEPAHVMTGSASQVTKNNFWEHPEAHPIVLDMLVLKAFGPDWLEWEPETLLIRIPETFHTAAISDLNLSKLQACRTLHMVDSFWEKWEVFVACLAPFNGEFPDFDVLRVPTVAECLVAIDIATRIREESFSEEVKLFVAAVYQHDGVYLPLPPADMLPVPNPPEGLSLDVLAKAWSEVRSSGHVPTGETVMDEQLRRLHIAWSYLEESRNRLQQQLSMYHV